MQIPPRQELAYGSYQHDHLVEFPSVSNPFDSFGPNARQTLIDGFVEFMKGIPADAWITVMPGAITAEWTRNVTEIGVPPALEELDNT